MIMIIIMVINVNTVESSPTVTLYNGHFLLSLWWPL